MQICFHFHFRCMWIKLNVLHLLRIYENWQSKPDLVYVHQRVAGTGVVTEIRWCEVCVCPVVTSHIRLHENVRNSLRMIPFFVCLQGHPKGGVSPLGFWTFQQKKVIFLVSSTKKHISPLLARPQNNFGKPLVPTMEKILPTPIFGCFCSS